MLRPVVTLSAVVLLAACGGADEAADDRMAAETTPAAAETVAAQEGGPQEDLLQWIRSEYADDVGEDGTLLYRYGKVDLNGDGTDEILAYVGGPMLCGTGGCNLVVLQQAGDAWQKVGDLSVSQLPVGVFDTSTNGWRDLAVSIYGGGGQSGVAKVPYGEDGYASNPTVPPAEVSTDSYETVIEDGPLDPVN